MQKSGQDQLSWDFAEVYPRCSNRISAKLLGELAVKTDVDGLPDFLSDNCTALQLAGYLADLARLELAVHKLKNAQYSFPANTATYVINPTMELYVNSWTAIAEIIGGEETLSPEVSREMVMVWRHPLNNQVQVKKITDEDLLVLKIVEEDLALSEVAELGKTHIAALEASLIAAQERGLITGPASLIERKYARELAGQIDPSFLSSRTFVLQWHITQSCDLHCRHCYDRDQYESLPMERGLAVLDDLQSFCREYQVHGQVNFSGGNPLLHPDFEKLYRAAANRGFTIGILGNPTSREQLQRLQEIQPLSFYQVSLEGLEQHNDFIRGQGHFQRIMGFLDLLKEMGIYSMVMLTLTRDNMDQVLELAEVLKGKTERFTFNRLSQVGEGAALAAVDSGEYEDFLRRYLKVADTNPAMALKDNLFNIICEAEGRPLFGGCAGHGCGAAFNFLAVLADGSVHACRKFPSPLGTIIDNSLAEIYASPQAEAYRAGPKDCCDCKLRAVCGGCLAVAHGRGVDVFNRKDPYCFLAKE